MGTGRIAGKRWRGWLRFLMAVVPLFVATGCPPQGGGGGRRPAAPIIQWPRPEPTPPQPADVWPPRAVWVVRQKYNSPEEIAAFMDKVQDAGLNTVLFQVRTAGTSYYRSQIEPFPYEYGGDPGFDPLEVACREAHRRGLALHAWVNVMPGWSGDKPPADPRQLYNARPDWFWYDQHGKRQPLGWYVSLNPCLPEVREYLVGVFEDLVRRYPVDGLHLDYIRFPTDESPKKSDYPYDARTLSLYKKETGLRPADDAARWSGWRTHQVSLLVWQIRSTVIRTRAKTKLTAACGHDPVAWQRFHFQDGAGWLRGKLVDMVFVMNYTADTRIFRQRQEAWQRAAGGRPTAPGIGAYLHTADRTTIEQLRLAQQWGQGFSLFSAASVFSDAPRSRQRLTSIRPLLLSMRRSSVAQALGLELPEVCLSPQQDAASDAVLY